jgi:hypothetical protein
MSGFCFGCSPMRAGRYSRAESGALPLSALLTLPMEFLRILFTSADWPALRRSDAKVSVPHFSTQRPKRFEIYMLAKVLGIFSRWDRFVTQRLPLL